MKPKFTLQVITFLLLLFNCDSSLVAQLVQKGDPISWNGKVSLTKKNGVVKMPGFDLQKVILEDAVNDQYKTRPWRFGYNYNVNLNPNNSGEWINLKNGDRLWLLQIESPGAKSINVIFDDFFIPEGAYLQMYNRDHSHMVGAYTHILNNEAKVLGTELVKGEFITIEYYEPHSVKAQTRLNIGTVTHGYRSLSLLADKIRKSLNDSGACNIDVLCPLGIGWEDQIRSVGLIIVNGNEGCSGLVYRMCSKYHILAKVNGNRIRTCIV